MLEKQLKEERNIESKEKKELTEKIQQLTLALDEDQQKNQTADKDEVI